LAYQALELLIGNVDTEREIQLTVRDHSYVALYPSISTLVWKKKKTRLFDPSTPIQAAFTSSHYLPAFFKAFNAWFAGRMGKPIQSSDYDWRLRVMIFLTTLNECVPCFSRCRPDCVLDEKDMLLLIEVFAIYVRHTLSLSSWSSWFSLIFVGFNSHHISLVKIPVIKRSNGLKNLHNHISVFQHFLTFFNNQLITNAVHNTHVLRLSTLPTYNLHRARGGILLLRQNLSALDREKEPAIGRILDVYCWNLEGRLDFKETLEDLRDMEKGLYRCAFEGGECIEPTGGLMKCWRVGLTSSPFSLWSSRNRVLTPTLATVRLF
jgi:hypothetical protein